MNSLLKSISLVLAIAIATVLLSASSIGNKYTGTLGTLSACAVPPCMLPDTANCDSMGNAAIYVEIDFNGTSTAQVVEKIANGVNFNAVGGTSGSTDNTYKMIEAGGDYGVQVTAYTSGTVAAYFQCVRRAK